jgi:hypothetical protein
VGTQRAIGRAGDGLSTRWTLGIPALLVLCLATTGCATSLSGNGPEVIRYCAEAAGAPSGDAPNCIPRP